MEVASRLRSHFHSIIHIMEGIFKVFLEVWRVYRCEDSGFMSESFLNYCLGPIFLIFRNNLLSVGYRRIQMKPRRFSVQVEVLVF